MKKITFLLFIALLPVFGFGQVDLATWNLNSNTNVSTSQSYVTATGIANTQVVNNITTDGVAFARFNEGSFSHYRCFQITIKPTSGNTLNLNNLVFSQTKLTSGPTHYRIKYYVSNNNTIPSDYDFFQNLSTWLAPEELIQDNPNKVISLAAIPALTGSQTLIIRFYARGGTDYHAYGWRINANTLKITGTNPNLIPPVPVAVNDSAETLQNNAIAINVLGNDTYNNLTPTINITQSPANGSASVNGSNQVVYTPNAGYTGTNTFQYTITNANGVSTPATVTVNVNAPVAPTAVADNFGVPMNQYTDLNVLANDNLGSAASITSITPTTPSHGIVAVNANNTIRYTPSNGYTGTDSFTYVFSTVYGTTSSVTVSLLVQPQTPTSGSLCGTYYVGTGGHFTTITQAVNYANSNGISCNVTFLLTNSTYNRASGESFPIVINEYTGANTYTLNIEPSSSVNAVAINSESYDSGNNNWVFPVAAIKFYRAKNIIIDGKDKLTVSNLNTASTPSWWTSVERSVIWFASSSTSLNNGSNNNTLKDLKIEAAFNETGQRAVGIRASNADINTNGVNSYNTIDGVGFKNCTHGVYILGHGATGNNQSSDWTIKNSDFDTEFNSPFYGFYLRNVRNFEISNNEIIDVYTTNNGYETSEVSGIHIAGTSLNYSSGKIFNNRILGIYSSQSSHQVSGIYLYGKDLNVYNNFVNNVRSVGNNGDASNGYSSAHGIFVRDANNLKLYHNSVRLLEGGGGFVNSALFIAGGSNLDVRNNIFVNQQTSGPTNRFAIFLNSGISSLTLDYNNYHSAGFIGAIGDPNTSSNKKQSFQNWKDANSGKDLNSSSVSPVFMNTLDLRLVPDETLNVQYLGGVALTNLAFDIPKDIEEDDRYIPRPTMGADEIDETRCIAQVTWNGTSWSSYTLNGITYNPPVDWQGNESVKIIISGPYTLVNASLLKSCQLEVIANPNAILTIGEDATYIVEDKLTLNEGSTMIVKDRGSFVQVNEPDINEIHVNSTFKVERKSQPMYKLDYTYWSSPIKQQSGYTLFDLSPTTVASKFYRWNEITQNWQIQAPNQEVMKEGRGYIVRAPQANNAVGQGPAAPHTAEFEGAPNNGIVTYTDIAGSSTENKWNLIGNPYPSAISIDEFYDNPDVNNKDKLEGTVYLWTHNTEINTTGGTGIYTYSPSDYAAYNKSGGTKAASGGEKPSGYIASGQAFFVKGIESGSVVFNNAMRVQAPNQNGQFFRPGTQEPINNWETTGKHRIWLNLIAETGFNQLLVGYIENATNEKDWGFDGDHFGGNQVSFYSILDSKNMAIQGRALPFNDQDEVPLGYKTTLTGTLKIAIDEVDGLFNGQDIYLEDKTLNIVHNLKEADYTFTTVPGTFNDRFVLRYVPAAELGTDNPTVDANSMVIFRDGSQINIKSNDQTIEHVTVYDLLGKVIFDKGSINAQSFSTSQLNVSNQVVIVKVITDTQAEVVKKVIMN